MYDTHFRNGVLDMYKGLPNLDMTLSDFTVFQNTTLIGWTRPTIQWSLDCEADGFTRKQALELLTENSVLLDGLHDRWTMFRYGVAILAVGLLTTFNLSIATAIFDARFIPATNALISFIICMINLSLFMKAK